VNQPVYDSGLFGEIATTGIVRDVGVTNAKLTGTGSGDVEGIGILASDNFGFVDGCWTTGVISTPGGDSGAPGGLVGGNFAGARISNSSSSVELSVKSGSATVGGLVGANFGSIDGSYAAGSTTVSNGYSAMVGGLAGYSSG